MHLSKKTIKVNSSVAQPDVINKAANIIKKGGIVSFPTKCIYGLGADPFNVYAVNKIFMIKKRSPDKPLLILINNLNAISEIVKNISTCAETIMKYFWPGGITIVFEAKTLLPDILTAGTGKIGIRMPGHVTTKALVTASGAITGTSANISGDPGCSRVSEIDPLLANNIDLILDAGTLKGGIGSTIIDATYNPPVILREGIISKKKIHYVLDNF